MNKSHLPIQRTMHQNEKQTSPQSACHCSIVFKDEIMAEEDLIRDGARPWQHG